MVTTETERYYEVCSASRDDHVIDEFSSQDEALTYLYECVRNVSQQRAEMYYITYVDERADQLTYLMVYNSPLRNWLNQMKKLEFRLASFYQIPAVKLTQYFESLHRVTYGLHFNQDSPWRLYEAELETADGQTGIGWGWTYDEALMYAFFNLVGDSEYGTSEGKHIPYPI